MKIDKIISPDESCENALCFVWDKKEIESIPEGVSLVTQGGHFPKDRNGIAINDPRNAMIDFLEIFSESKPHSPGIHPQSWVSPEACVSPCAVIGPFCVISDKAIIGDNSVLRAGVYIGEGSSVGSGTLIEPNVAIYRGCFIGSECTVHSGAVIGSEGFGFIPGEGKPPRKIPQVGGVRIGNNVEIGSSTTVDRGTIGDTVIEDNVKIDNQVQVGHNVKVGKNCIIVAQVGLAGSSILEGNVVMAARSATGDHVRIGSGSTVAANGGAIKDVSPGSVVSGFPARDHRKNFRIAALLQRLPKLFERVKTLEKRLEDSSKEDH